ncbi:uncharacterized protein I303_105778 [Kwoniella dejecticola CBS 10117]|uniref:DUF1764 domain-containing protein n=1 Tax=Kwoniella dejecticola CBS 10117 TaxID=1296121 RepID=A0AAJ8KSQ3_9TREE
MAKKASTSTSTSTSTQTSNGSSSKKLSTQKGKAVSTQTSSNSNSIDDIFAAPKKRKAEDIVATTSKSNIVKKGKNNAQAEPAGKLSGSSSTLKPKGESSSRKSKDIVESERKKQKHKAVPEEPDFKSEDEDEDEEEDDNEEGDISSDDFDSEDYSDFEDEDDDDEDGGQNGARKVEEVFDPSSLSEIKKKIEAQRAKHKLTAAAASGKKRSGKDREDDALFADSRGLGTGRKTEEGFTIYKEVDLQIDPTAGGTPLCPFDCDCCF